MCSFQGTSLLYVNSFCKELFRWHFYARISLLLWIHLWFEISSFSKHFSRHLSIVVNISLMIWNFIILKYILAYLHIIIAKVSYDLENCIWGSWIAKMLPDIRARNRFGLKDVIYESDWIWSGDTSCTWNQRTYPAFMFCNLFYII